MSSIKNLFKTEKIQRSRYLKKLFAQYQSWEEFNECHFCDSMLINRRCCFLQAFCSKRRLTSPTTFRILFFIFPNSAWMEERQLHSRQSSTEGSPVNAVARIWASLGRSNDRTEFELSAILLVFPPNIPPNYGHRFWGRGREHTKCSLKLSRHLTRLRS
jgi:hypothetical protein